jgi:hypothetical protein
MRAGYKKYPAIENEEPVVFYNKPQEIPVASEKIGELQAYSQYWMNCDSICIFSLAEAKIKKVGGNALLVTDFSKPINSFANPLKYYLSLMHNPSRNPLSFSLKGDVFFVSDFSSPPDTVKQLDIFTDNGWYGGFGFGQETGISLPKISFYNFQKRNSFETYYGAEVGIFGFVAFWMSLDCLYGIKKNLFTFDTSVGMLWIPPQGNPDAEHSFYPTINPKIGIKYRRLWLKTGPAINLSNEKVNIGKIGNMYFNFEILIKM